MHDYLTANPAPKQTLPLPVKPHTITMPQASPLTSPRIAVDRELSTPTGRGSYQTVTEKADLYELEIMWNWDESDPTSMGLTSPASGNFYRITYKTARGRHVCDCPAGRAGRDCWHIVAFWRGWLGEFAHVFLPKPSAPETTTPAARPLWDAATFAANVANDFGN